MENTFCNRLLQRVRRAVLVFMFLAILLGYRLQLLMQPTLSEFFGLSTTYVVDETTNIEANVMLNQMHHSEPLLPLGVLLDRSYQPLAELSRVSRPVISGDVPPEEICRRVGRAYYADEWQKLGSVLYWRSELSEREWGLLRNDEDLRVQPIYLAEPKHIYAEHLAGEGGAGIENAEAALRWQELLWNWFEHQNSASDLKNEYYAVTTLRSDLQRIVENIAAEKIAKGGILVLEAGGEIAALVSKPSTYATAYEAPFLNRIFASFPPGSLFKLLIAGLALDSGLIAEDSLFYCPGYYELPDRHLGCTGVHGWLDLKAAVAQSCNAAFAEIGVRLGYDRLCQALRNLQFNSAHNMPVADLPDDADDTLPDEIMLGEMANLSIGQGQLLATPFDMGLLYCTVANGGVLPVPQLIRGWINANQVFRPFYTASNTNASLRLWSEETNRILLSALRQTIEEGTGHFAASNEISIAGKSGTAELGDGTTNHAWFAALAPAEQPRYVVIVFIEEGQWGGAVAGPIAKDVMEEIFRIVPK